jgi:hypothetical protein
MVHSPGLSFHHHLQRHTPLLLQLLLLVYYYVINRIKSEKNISGTGSN